MWGKPLVTGGFRLQRLVTRRFLWTAPEQTVEQRIEARVIWDAIALIMKSSKLYLGEAGPSPYSKNIHPKLRSMEQTYWCDRLVFLRRMGQNGNFGMSVKTAMMNQWPVSFRKCPFHNPRLLTRRHHGFWVVGGYVVSLSEVISDSTRILCIRCTQALSDSMIICTIRLFPSQYGLGRSHQYKIGWINLIFQVCFF